MELRNWQKKALSEWKKNKSGVAKVVTGGGKTFFAISCISHLLKLQQDIKVLILVPSITLLDQWVIDLQDNFEFQIDKIGGGFNTGLANQICVCTYGSLNKITDKVKRNNTFLICDECHKAATDRIGSLLRQGWNATLGLSATPERDFDENFDSILVPIWKNYL